MNKSGKFEQEIRNKLDESLVDLTPEISRRLQQARYNAIEKAQAKKQWRFIPQAKYAMFALAIVSISVLYNVHEKQSEQTTLAMESDIEMLTSNESLELLQDLEFMQWLAETEQNVS